MKACSGSLGLVAIPPWFAAGERFSDSVFLMNIPPPRGRGERKDHTVPTNVGSVVQEYGEYEIATPLSESGLAMTGWVCLLYFPVPHSAVARRTPATIVPL